MSTQKYLADLLKIEESQLAKLELIAKESFKNDEIVSQKLKELEDRKYTFGENLADKVAEFGGSWRFIIIFATIIIIWISINALFLNAQKAFDPYPFILLNLVLSCLAALQAPIIMMSQNRQEIKDRRRAENDYVINLKAELEIKELHQKIDLLMLEHMKNLFDIQKKQLTLLENINVNK